MLKHNALKSSVEKVYHQKIDYVMQRSRKTPLSLFIFGFKSFVVPHQQLRLGFWLFVCLVL